LIVADISVIPMGAGQGTSVSPIVRKAVKALQAQGLRTMAGPMSTAFEAPTIDEVFAGAKAAHMAAVEAGARRVITTIKIDDRRDKEQSMESKMAAVNR
jgi:uncharacterized protein (TIGR00106 family)